MKVVKETLMVNTNKAYYLKLEDEIYYLRVHYSMCQGIQKEEILEWARFFLTWSRKASQDCEIWSQENLQRVEKFVKSLEKSKVDPESYGTLEKMLAEAALHLNHEILKVFQGPGLALDIGEKRLFP